MCRTCESDNRNIWTYTNAPSLPDIKVANWISLQKCPECGALWCEVPYEPYGSFKFLVKWPYDEACFSSISSIDNSLILHEWHSAFIRENWESLNNNEIEAINKWRHRTYMNYNPIDKNLKENPAKYLATANGIAKYVQ